VTNDSTLSIEGLLLPGLDGSNPLGFLAALGTLRLLNSSARIKWIRNFGTWLPVVSFSDGQPIEEHSFLDALHARLVDDISKHPASMLRLFRNDSVNARREVFIEHCQKATYVDRLLVDWLCALASEVAAVDAINQLQTTRRDYFLGNLTAIMKRTTRDHLRRSIFSRWDYADSLENQSLHLDPSEDRRHAHQWNKPSGDPNRKKSGGMLGANRLAIEAIPLFPSMPEDDALHTVGFTGNRSTNTRWTWPIWSVPVSLQVVRSLLAIPMLQIEKLSPRQKDNLHDSGIVTAFRTNRILVEKTPNFTPARRIA
jgi:CRISPR-associated endonuclease/helicase Cas3